MGNGVLGLTMLILSIRIRGESLGVASAHARIGNETDPHRHSPPIKSRSATPVSHMTPADSSR